MKTTSLTSIIVGIAIAVLVVIAIVFESDTPGSRQTAKIGALMPTTIGRRTTPESSESQNSPTSRAAPGPVAPEEGGGGGVVGRAATPSATRAAATAPGGSGVAGRRAWKFVATRPVAAADVVSQTAPPTAETAFATVSSPTPVESEAE